MNKIKLNLIVSILLILVFFVSCSKSKKEYFENGNLKAEYQTTKKGSLEGEFKLYYKNGNIKSIDLFKNNIKIDSSKFYDSLNSKTIKKVVFWNKNSLENYYLKNYEKGEIFNEGQISNSLKTGKWKYYKDKKIDKVLQYKNINDIQYLNQGWYFDKLGDTIEESGNNYKFNYSGTQKKKLTEVDISITYNPLIAINSDVILLFSNQLDEKFSNIDKVTLDTVVFANNKVDFKIGIKGNVNFRGLIKEYANIVPKDSIVYKERFVYLDEIISVNN